MKTLITLDQTEIQSFIADQKPDRHRESAKAAFERIVAEHAALVAVAEAAKDLRPALDPIPDIAMNGFLCAGCGNWTPKGHPEAHDHDDNCPEVRKRSALAAQSSHNERHGKRILDEALANLAAVRAK